MIITLNSKWLTNDRRTVKVVGIWAVGAGDSYRAVAYDLLIEGTKNKIIERDELIRLIENKQITQQ